MALFVIDGFGTVLSRTSAQRSRHSGSLRHAGARETVILQCAGALGVEVTMSGSGFTMIRNITKHTAAMKNVTTLKTSFMRDSETIPYFAAPPWSQRSSHSGLLDPRGINTVRKEAGVRDRSFSVIP